MTTKVRSPGMQKHTLHEGVKKLGPALYANPSSYYIPVLVRLKDQESS